MGSTLSKSEGCLHMVWCGGGDDAYPADPPELANDATFPLAEDLELSQERHVVRLGQRLPSQSAHANLYPPAQELAPSTNEDLRNNAGTGQHAPHGVPSSQRGLGSLQRKQQKKHGPNSPQAAAALVEEPLTPAPMTTDRLLQRENLGDGTEDGVDEGLTSFFHPERDELMEDIEWLPTKRGPSLAALLQRVEYLGNVDMALSEVRSMQEQDYRGEGVVRSKVLERFLLVMGPEGRGLAVKKYQRSKTFGPGGSERGKWAARTIRFEWNGIDSLEDGTPLGGAIVWNSKRLFPREQREVRIADIAKVEHSGNFVWMTADGESRLGFETSSNMNARFLCRSIDFLVSATVQHRTHSGGDGSKRYSLTSTGSSNDAPAIPASYLSPLGV
ncbi:unnamed protein product [Ectocarpus fasciculatus]